MKKLEIGILYIGLHNHLIKYFGSNCNVRRKDMFAKISRHWLIPKSARCLIIKEMEEKNLIKIINRDEVCILPFDIDLENDINKLYKMAGIF